VACLDDDEKLFFLSPDTSPFWMDLVRFFENIAAGSLPAECRHENRLTFIENINHYWTTFRAEPIGSGQNFRLKIYTKQDDEEEFLYFDEVVDRTAFVRGFAASFSDFLQNHYQVKPDPDGKTFDLRTLSLEKLLQA
jgi:hypothetical protein